MSIYFNQLQKKRKTMLKEIPSKLLSVLMYATLIFVMSACSIKQEMNQPKQKDLSVFDLGSKRADVIKEIGKAIESKLEKDNSLSETYSFTQSYSPNIKTSRIVGHAFMNLATFGLYEILATQDETQSLGQKVVLIINYDQNNKIKEVKTIVGKGILVKN